MFEEFFRACKGSKILCNMQIYNRQIFKGA